MAFMLFGVGIIVREGIAAGHLFGDAMALASAFILAAAITVSRGSGKDMSFAAIISTAVPFLIAATMVATHGFSIGDPVWIVVNGGLVMPVTFFCLAIGPRFLSGPEVAMFYLLETVFAPVWVWFIFGEAPSRQSLIGGTILIVALVVHSLWQFNGARKRARARAAVPPYPVDGRSNQPNLPLRGKPFGTMRPAEARAPIHSASSACGLTKVRSAESRPATALLDGEGARVGNAAVLVFLQADALAARHFGNVGEREDQHLAVVADDGDVVARSTGTQSLASSGSVTFITCLPLRVLARSSASGATKPLPAAGDEEQLARRASWTKAVTMSWSFSMSTMMRTGSPWPRPPGSVAATSV